MNRHPATRLPASALVAALALTASPLAAQTVDPDPELFDGTRTKKEQIDQEKRPPVDQWQEANLILYDSDEQGSEQGGQGRVGFEGPGYAEGVQGGTGLQAGVPMPIPIGGGGSGDPSQQTIPGMIPTSDQSSSMAGASSQSQGNPPAGGGPQGPQGKPGEVAIGDPSQTIAAGARPVSRVQGGAAPPSGEEIRESKGEDTTQIPNSASGQQSAPRGGGVEKGDAMPSDI